MTVYKVQVFQSQLKDWEQIAAFKPDYRLGTMRLGPWWHPFKKLIGVASNFEEAERGALIRARSLAKKTLRRFHCLRASWSVRVLRESTWTGREVKDVMWLDGKNKLSLRRIFKRTQSA